MEYEGIHLVIKHLKIKGETEKRRSEIEKKLKWGKNEWKKYCTNLVYDGE